MCFQIEKIITAKRRQTRTMKSSQINFTKNNFFFVFSQTALLFVPGIAFLKLPPTVLYIDDTISF